MGDYKLMRHLNSGELKLFNLKTDYREEKNLASKMLEKVAAMDSSRRNYVEDVDGGTADQVRQAHYKLMDRFSEQSKEGYRKKLVALEEQEVSDFEARKAVMLKELNQKLFKNALSKEKSKLHAKLHSWREGPEKKIAEEKARANWVDYSD
jgi:hypothetical protein